MKCAKAVILLSGGVDSSTLLAYLRRELECPEVHALSFVYGQKHRREVEMAKRQAERWQVARHTVVDLSFYGALTAGGSALTDPALAVPDLAAIEPAARAQPPTYVPHRNLVLLSLAAGYAEAAGIRDVYYGAQAQDLAGYWDCTPDFVTRLNAVLALNRRDGVQVQAPFATWKKADVIRLGKRLGVDYAATWSCYRGQEIACGRCPSCVERQNAFAAVEKG